MLVLPRRMKGEVEEVLVVEVVAAVIVIEIRASHYAILARVPRVMIALTRMMHESCRRTIRE